MGGVASFVHTAYTQTQTHRVIDWQ